MERLTAKENGHYYYPRCFEGECDGASERCEDCEFEAEVCMRLGQYEDSGLYPDEIRRLKEGKQDFVFGFSGVKSFYCQCGRHYVNADCVGWIPVEREMPKTNGIYNVTRHIDGQFISDSAYFDGQNTWHSDNRVNHSRHYLIDVIAWRPLPEPYCPEGSKQ